MSMCRCGSQTNDGCYRLKCSLYRADVIIIRHPDVTTGDLYGLSSTDEEEE